jgi:caffeoyl-CoA O-methyltransferase
MSIKAPHITPELYQYMTEMSVHENEYLRQLRLATVILPNGQMMASPEQSQFLALLTVLMQAKNVIEIGTFTGYTTLAIAQVLPAKGKIITCDIDPHPLEIGEGYWQQAGVEDKIESVIKSGITLLDELIADGKTGSFDLAFVDADKKNNHEYYKKLLILLRKGGLIAIDNVLWKGNVLETMSTNGVTLAIKEFNALLAQDSRIMLSIIPLGDGLTLAVKL